MHKSNLQDNLQQYDDDLNQLWLVVRHMKVGKCQNQFELRGGETFKVGRIVFTVKELCNNKV